MCPFQVADNKISAMDGLLPGIGVDPTEVRVGGRRTSTPMREKESPDQVVA